jgi:hypothetical protein
METWLGIDIGIRNLSSCLIKKQKTGTWTIVQWKLIDMLDFCNNRFRSCNDMHSIDVHSLSEHLLPKLFPLNKFPTYVCIEQQPHGKYGNQKLVLLSHLIYSYFRQVLINAKFGQNLLAVKFVSPNSKYCNPWLQKYGHVKGKTYVARKKLSVALFKNLVHEHKVCNESGISFDDHNKKDDLADSFLLAFHTALFAPHGFLLTRGRLLN